VNDALYSRKAWRCPSAGVSRAVVTDSRSVAWYSQPALQRLSLPAICQFPARNARLKVEIAKELAKAEAKGKESGKPQRMFKELRYRTRKTWSRERRVVAKAEHLPKGANPRFIVTSLIGEAVEAQRLYKKIYCAQDLCLRRSRTGP
jgi:hypothetical protein